MRKVIPIFLSLAAGVCNSVQAADFWPWSNESSVAHTTHTQMLDGKPLNHVSTPAIDHSQPSGFQQIGSGMKSLWNQTTSVFTPAPAQPKPSVGGGIMTKPAPLTGQKVVQTPATPVAKKLSTAGTTTP